MTTRIIESGDGSHTLRVEALNENYHSHKGAIRESLHVFIEKGLGCFEKDAPIRILEVGFGTGLNALLTWLHRSERAIHYTALEAYPLESELVSRLNYPDLIEGERMADRFQQLHQAAWNQSVELASGFELNKKHIRLEEFQSKEGFDLIYYDAFAPHAQPELWEQVIWNQVAGLMNPGGVLVTYCAKGQVRRDMQAAGLETERLEGPPGKREMLRARKPE